MRAKFAAIIIIVIALSNILPSQSVESYSRIIEDLMIEVPG